MLTEELLTKVENPPMYGTYYLVKKSKGWRLMLRTYAAVEVEWDHIAHLDSGSLDALQRAGVSTWN
jgi:hypothetical protein